MMANYGQLRCFGQVEQIADSDWVLYWPDCLVKGENCRERGRQTWNPYMRNGGQQLGLKIHNAQNTSVWKLA